MQLNEQQKQSQDLILNSNKNFFLSGFAGTGKTALLRDIIQSLRAKNRGVRVCAFTGMAAQHLHGTTIAKLLGLGLARRLEDFHKVDLDRAERNLRSATDIVVDEVSMISGDYLELMDWVMRGATGNPEPFGGIRMIFGGDFMQLPPIQTQYGPAAKLPWSFEYSEFQECLSLFLTQSMRQSNEEETDLLNEFRQGIITPQGVEFLRSALHTLPENPVDLYPLRREVESINQTRLAQSPGVTRTYRTLSFPSEREELLLSHVPVGKEVVLKMDVPVIILMNDPAERFVNGSQGRVQRFLSDSVRVELNNGNLVEVPVKTWEVLGPQEETLGHVRGLPLQLGWAATIHRAQGMTLDSVVTDISRCWEPGQAYVALSRTKSLRQLRLLSPVQKIKADPVALAYVNTLF